VDATNPIAIAIPFFLLLIGLEVAVARRRGRSVYRVEDALADLGCGIGQQVALVFFAATLLALYEAFHERFRLLDFAPGSIWPWVIAFLYVDFAYYWWHRASHEVNLFWAAHAVHHQSEDYNLAVALRQGIVTSFTSLPFNLPMALLGVPTPVYAAMLAISLLYQFWVHTELVGRLGPAEWVLNTPSHHRVHHAINPRYLDRNYAAILIVWDRLFGTFAEERERPVYGTTKPIRSFDPLWAQVHEFAVVAHKARALPRWRDRVAIWFRSPSWSPAGEPLPTEEEIQSREKYAGTHLSRASRLYATIQFAPLVAVTFFMLLSERTAPLLVLAVAALLVFGTLLSVGALLDGRPWARRAEVLRLAAVAAALAVWGSGVAV
jgi:sterol desaturase/sphingolipid hydroxylase (fatty acid hydroxylase superfamily)